MSVAELPDRRDDHAPAAGYDRTPPQDVPAEQSVLGGMLLSKDAIADVVEVLRGHDMYRPAHETIYDTILDLYGRGEPADPLTVADELKKRGELGRVGGAPYLHTLVSSVPTAANAGYYAEIVRERAVLRRLVEAGMRIVQMGYGGDGDADDIVDRAQAEVYSVTDRRTSDDYLPLGDIMEGTLDEIEAIGSRGGQMVGVPTGFADLDALTNGLHPGQMIVIAARPAIGKALALDTPLPTPCGWTTMGAVAIGDELIGADGKPTRVVAATAVMEGRPCYEVEFSDGSIIVADAQHQWAVTTRGARRGGSDRVPVGRYAGSGSEPAGRVHSSGGSRRSDRRRTAENDHIVSTETMAATLHGSAAHGRPGHAVRLARPFDLPDADLPVPPYEFGVWLGDGDQQDHGVAADALRRIGVLGHKHIPEVYLRASQRQRRALLAGLLDADGSIDETGRVRVELTSRRLADGALELISSLGFLGRLRIRRVDAASTCYRIAFTPGGAVFRVRRKLDRQRFDHAPSGRMVVDVRRIRSVPVRCVEVDNAEHLYLAGRSCIPTHNSTLGLDIARAAAIRQQLTSVMFSLEMSRNEITMRLLSAEARVPLHHMRSGQMTDDDWNRIARRTGEVSSAPLFIDDSPNMTMMEIRAKCRRLKQRHDLRLVVIDYLQLMTSGKRVESRQQEVAEFSRALKLLAKELDVPVVAISQLNRSAEQRTDKKPMLADLRESGSIEQDSDMVILLHREDAYEKESPRAGEADFIVAKHRNGPTATITVAFQGHYSRFVDMAQ
ncbi:MAG: replicative DNA helicase [Jiangellaceae bacterium]